MDLIPSKVVQQKILQIAEDKLKTKEYKVNAERGTEKGDNYIGIVYKATICASCKDDTENNNCDQDNCRKLNLIVKVPPENKIRRDKFYARHCFLREAFMYDEALPTFMKFQESKGIIPIESGFYEIAPSFGTITDELHEAIILKDLTFDGFEMFNRHNYIPNDHAHLIMKILGKFHAISFAMKDQCPEEFEKYKSLEDIFKARAEEEELTAYLDMMRVRAISTLDPEEHKDYIEILNNICVEHTLMQLLVKLTDSDAAEPYAVVAHGDCWNNNILYKYKNGKLSDARLIDWQISRYSSPVCDLMYFLFLATSQESRSKHYNSFLNTYYESLSTLLTRLGSNPEKLFPRKGLDEQLKKFGKFGFIMGIMLVPILTTYAEDVPDLDQVSETLAKKELLPDAFKSERSEGAYKERMRGIILDMFKLGYL